MKAEYGKDASGRTTIEILEWPAAQYPHLRDAIAKKFALAPKMELVQTHDVVAQDFEQGTAIVGIEWDIWSGFCVVAKTACAKDLVHQIGAFLLESVRVDP